MARIKAMSKEELEEKETLDRLNSDDEAGGIIGSKLDETLEGFLGRR